MDLCSFTDTCLLDGTAVLTDYPHLKVKFIVPYNTTALFDRKYLIWYLNSWLDLLLNLFLKMRQSVILGIGFYKQRVGSARTFQIVSVAFDE
jgi:hypothetical protein